MAINLPMGDRIYYAFQQPAKATIEDLRVCCLSSRKSEYIRGLAKLNLVGLDLEKFKDCRDRKR